MVHELKFLWLKSSKWTLNNGSIFHDRLVCLWEFLGADVQKVMEAYMLRSPKLAFYWRNSNMYSNKVLFHLMYAQTKGFFWLLIIFLTMLQNKDFGLLKPQLYLRLTYLSESCDYFGCQLARYWVWPDKDSKTSEMDLSTCFWTLTDKWYAASPMRAQFNKSPSPIGVELRNPSPVC